jgi:hypothetical protein
VTAVTPKPGKGWRLLKVGEAIPSDGEFHSGGAWLSSVSIGCLYDTDDQREGLFYRTREGVKPVKKKPNWHRITLAMSKARTIGEARKIYARGEK